MNPIRKNKKRKHKPRPIARIARIAKPKIARKEKNLHPTAYLVPERIPSR